jgi:putative pyruvate formate lyase activating enzyme
LLSHALIVRHLVLPGHLDSTREVLRWFAENCAGRNGGPLLSLMFQYTPVPAGRHGAVRSGPDRFASKAEYHTVLGWLSEFGIEDGYCQELAPGSDWLPDFEKPNPFPSNLSIPVWHWKTGLCTDDT